MTFIGTNVVVETPVDIDFQYVGTPVYQIVRRHIFSHRNQMCIPLLVFVCTSCLKIKSLPLGQ
jgi:hypothetical protein